MPSIDEMLGSETPSAADTLQQAQPMTADEALIGTTPEQRMSALAPIVAQYGSSPTDNKAYIQAYKDYYDQNPRAKVIGDAVNDLVTNPIGDEAKAAEWGYGLYQQAKQAATTDIPTWFKNITSQDSPNSALGKLQTPVAAAGGATAGVLGMGQSAVNAVGYLREQYNDLLGDLPGMSGNHLVAAQDALVRLKEDHMAGQIIGNPYDQATQPRQYAAFQTGNLASAMLAPEATGATGAIGAAGDVVENGAYKTIGQGMKAIPPVLKTGEAVGKLAALYTHPITVGGSAVAGAVADVAGVPPGLNPYSLLQKGASVQSGLFEAVQGAGDAVKATPLGQNVLSSIATQGDTYVQAANQKVMVANAAVSDAAEALKTADEADLNTVAERSALKAAQNAATQANVNAYITEKGANVAKWLQQTTAGQTAAQIPGKMADALAGTVMGGVIGGTNAMTTAQPGEDDTITNGISKGAFYGGILGMLGGAGAAAERGRTPPEVPDTRTEYYTGGDTGSSIRQEAMATVDKGASFIINGKPHDAQTFTQTLKNQVGPFVDAAQKDTAAAPYATGDFAPAGWKPGMAKIDASAPAAAAAPPVIPTGASAPEAPILSNPNPGTASKPTFNITVAQPRAKGGIAISPQPSDQILTELAGAHKVIQSSPLKDLAYDPNSQIASVRFTPPGQQGIVHYVYGGVTPDDFNDWINGKGFVDPNTNKASAGKYFNALIRTKKPYLAVKDNLFPEEPIKPADPAAGGSDVLPPK